MSFTDTGRGERSLPTDAIALAGVLVFAVLAMLFLSSARNDGLRRSAAGFDGLALWLAADGMDAQPFTGGWTIPAEEVGLNIIPVYDADLDTARESPTTKQELLLQRDEVDLRARVIRQKAEMAQTLIVLPKWRSGMRLTGLAHPVLLIEGRDSASVLQDVRTNLDDDAGTVGHIPVPYTDFDYQSSDNRLLSARLYVAQTFEGNGCRPEIGRPGNMILGRCLLKAGNSGDWIYVLSDPDLLNNHGLRLGDNAEIAHDLIGKLANGKRVIVDYSRDNWLTEAASYDHPDRTWSDLARFFSYPFSLLWLGAGLTLALFIWRGSVRFGPLTGGEVELAASKSVMIGARARMMRLTGQDGALLREYTRARVGVMAHRLLGPEGAKQEEAALVRYAERRDPALRARLEDALKRIYALPVALTADEAIGHVDTLESIMERLTDDT